MWSIAIAWINFPGRKLNSRKAREMESHCDKMKERKMAAKGHDIKDMGRKEEHLQRHETKGPLSKE